VARQGPQAVLRRKVVARKAAWPKSLPCLIKAKAKSKAQQSAKRKEEKNSFPLAEREKVLTFATPIRMSGAGFESQKRRAALSCENL
jgi:hypothetical protein